MTDGGAHLIHTRGTIDFLARNALMPQLIIVGVTNTDRTRDLTPTRVESQDFGGQVFEAPTSGGGDRFLDFFEQELFPYIDSNYRTVPLRLFAGHSFGGLFALHAFFTRPGTFNTVLAVSPSLRWDDNLPIRQSRTFFDGRSTLNASLFVAMANEEAGDPAPTRLDLLERELEKASVEGFAWSVMRMPEETHGSVVLRAHYWGLRDAFAGWGLPRNPENGRYEGDLDDLKQHYAALSKRYGFSIRPSENVVNNVGYEMLGRDDFTSAIAIFQYNIELYPESANAYDSLGEGLENSGEIEKAFASYQKAVEQAEKIGDERLSIFEANRDRARKALDEVR